MDSRTALDHAIASVPVPGAPPRDHGADAAIGLSFLDSALRLNHVRRLTERLTVVDHRIAARTTEIDLSLPMLHEGQRRAGALARHLRTVDPPERTDDERTGRIWVPVARIPRTSAAPVDITDATGTRLPRLTQHECSRLLASGLFRLLRGILASLPGASPDSELHRFLHRAHESEWLVQHAIEVLTTERHLPGSALPGADEPSVAGVVDGQGARFRSLAVDVLAKHQGALIEFFELLDVALTNDLLVVALDQGTEEHLLTYQTPLHVERRARPRRGPRRLLRTSSEGYYLQYHSEIPSSIPAYNLVVEAETGIDIARMYLSTDVDVRAADALGTDLVVLAQRLENERAARRAHASWRRSPTATAGAPIRIRVGMLLRDTTSAGPRKVCLYALLVAVTGGVLAMFLAGTPWAFGSAARERLGRVSDADAVVSVLLLVPGFLYTRLSLADRRTIAGHLRSLPRLVAHVSILVVAGVAGAIAGGLPGALVQVAFAAMVIAPFCGAMTLLYRRTERSDTVELVRLDAPGWLDGADVEPVEPDTRFTSTAEAK